MKLLYRKQLLEAWESAEWDSREAQIRTLQEAQIREFEDSIKAKHAQVAQPGSISSSRCFAHLPDLRDMEPHTRAEFAGRLLLG